MFPKISFTGGIKTGAAGIGTRVVGKIFCHKFARILTVGHQAVIQHLYFHKVEHPKPFLARRQAEIDDGNHFRTMNGLLLFKQFVT